MKMGSTVLDSNCTGPEHGCRVRPTVLDELDEHDEQRVVTTGFTTVTQREPLSLMLGVCVALEKKIQARREDRTD